jgi:hypothetical protein
MQRIDHGVAGHASLLVAALPSSLSLNGHGCQRERERESDVKRMKIKVLVPRAHQCENRTHLEPRWIRRAVEVYEGGGECEEGGGGA